MSRKKAVDPEYAASERDYYIGHLDDWLNRQPDALELRMVMFDALNAARWANAADGTDERIVELLRTAGQLGVALLESLRGHAIDVPVRDGLLRVPLDLPADGYTSASWADTLFAATAASDAASAVRLSRVRTFAFTPAGPAGLTELASALASAWTGDGQVSSHLVASLEQTDPKDLPESEVDAALDLVVPAAAVFQAIIGADTGAADVDRELAKGAELFAKFWAGEQPEVLMSVRLTGLAALAHELRIPTSVAHPVLPEVIMNRPPTTALGCPVCTEPFDKAQHECAWCGTNLTADAPLELSLGEWLTAARKPCHNCGSLTHAEALRCWLCGERLTR
jgi:hypothetical protein